MALLTVLLVTIGASLGGQGGMMMAFIFAVIMNGVSYWFSDKIVLRMYGAKEISADETGAAISGEPLSLANALRKLERGMERIPMEANPATAHMFIVNPLIGGGLMTLFSTHPPMQERIRRLESMAGIRQ